jgi:hypothetical protein
MALILLPFWLAFHVLRLAVLAVLITVAALIFVTRLTIAGGRRAYRWNQARRAQLWADTHRYPLSLPDLREAGR